MSEQTNSWLDCLGTSYLEAERMLIARPHTGVRIKKKALLILLRNIVVHVLCDTELAMELWQKY